MTPSVKAQSVRTGGSWCRSTTWQVTLRPQCRQHWCSASSTCLPFTIHVLCPPQRHSTSLGTPSQAHPKLYLLGDSKPGKFSGKDQQAQGQSRTVCQSTNTEPQVAKSLASPTLKTKPSILITLCPQRLVWCLSLWC